jgi:hypothetical protein
MPAGVRGGARPDRDGLKQARRDQLARLACEVDQGRGGEPGAQPAAVAQRDHGARESGALERRVDRPKQLPERFLGGIRIVRGERVAEAIERRGVELRQLPVQREIELGQVRQLAEQVLEVVLRDVAQLPRPPPSQRGRGTRARLSSDGPPGTPQHRFALRPEPHEQRWFRPTFATGRI